MADADWMDEEEEWEEYDDQRDVPTFGDGHRAWEHILPTGKKQASGRGVNLVNRLKHPPPLDAVSRALKDTTPYTGLPEAPPARAQGQDRSLHFLQRKLEHVMNKLVDIAT